MSNKSGISSQAITLPSGGGALKGIGETFSPDLFTGTGNFTVPIGLPPGRNGFQPQLSLVYSTGNGNGPFGLGWDLSVPGVSRKTSKGVPRYRDNVADPTARDTFILSGAEDLVPIAEPESGVIRFRPRTEGIFARIERLRTAGDDFWRVRSKDGLVSIYGTPLIVSGDPAVVADPALRTKIFCWKLSQTTDPFGNQIDYQYLRDSGTDGPHVWDQLYLQRVRYVDYNQGGQARFLVSVTFIYEPRHDPFSEYRAGFEIRTRLRCKRIEIRTHADQERLTRTYELVYLDERVRAGELPSASLPHNGVSLLSQVRVVGHDGDKAEALPPLEFSYTRFVPEQRRFQQIKAVNDALPPRSLADESFEMVGLFGNGLPDIVQMNGSVQFWRNLGNGLFDTPQTMNEVPAGVHLRDPGVQFADMNGDGRADLLVLPQQGYFPLSFQGRWSRQGFVQYAQAPNVSFGDNNIRLVDLDGDGVVDALRTGVSFELYFNDPLKGWETVETRPRRPLEAFPDLNFSNPRVKLADLNGDDLQDFVLVDQGRIDYWPYQGHGQWGRRVTMQNSPVFRDNPPLPGGEFDPRRILLGDLDGDGLDDIVYVEPNRLTFWINQGGERWSDPIIITGTPPFTDVDAVRLADMLGTGMAGVLWTFDRIAGTGSNFQFLDLTGDIKPYLLEQMDNHMGAVTRVQYTSSTKFYLSDVEKPTSRWQTNLPFPVQVVERVEVIDDISKGKLTTEYRYHHGYWDGAEREFRGFGMVEQVDTQLFERFNQAGLHGNERSFTSVSQAQFSPPTLTKTWFHLGPVGDEFLERREADFSHEYWAEDPPIFGRAQEMDVLLSRLPASERANAFRALRGMTLRTELFALDGTGFASRPYTVAETQYAVREESPPATVTEKRQRIFFPLLVAQRTTQWERGSEPMTSFSFTGSYDEYGMPGAQTTLAVPRRRNFRVAAPPGEPYLGTHTVTTFSRRNDDDHYMVDRVASTTAFEIVNDGSQALFDLATEVSNGAATLALFTQTFNYYDGAAFVGLEMGVLGDFGALVRSEALVLTEQILHDAYKSGDAVLSPPERPPYLDPNGGPNGTAEYPAEFQQLMPPLAGYVFADGTDHRTRGYFVQATRTQFDFQVPSSPGRHGLPINIRDPLGNDTTITYDDFALLPVTVSDAVGLVTTAIYDYRVLQPRRVTDPNQNRVEFRFTPLGLPAASFTGGKQNAQEGDRERPGTLFNYDFLAYVNSPEDARQPVCVRTMRHEHHDTETDVALPERDATIETVEYSDGFGRLLQTRTQAEDLLFGDAALDAPLFGNDVCPAAQGDTNSTLAAVVGRRRKPDDPPNVVVSGWQIYDNKGQVVEKFEPFFSTGFAYLSPDEELRRFGRNVLGQKVTQFYDPRGQVIRTLNPDGSEQRVIFGVPGRLQDPVLTMPDTFDPTPWEAYTYDANDLAPLSVGLQPDGTAGPLANRAPAHHHFTPASIVVDALGRTVLAVTRNRAAVGQPIEEFHTVSTYDIRGNLLSVTDPLGRVAFHYTYDLANHPLRIESIDAGLRRTVLDVMGNEMERRDSKGALILQSYDRLHRPVRRWARDDQGSPPLPTLRERLEYGDGGVLGQPSGERERQRAANRLGKPHKQYDEAGLLTFESYDFKGNLLEKMRQVIRDDAILAIFPNPNWDVRPLRVDWDPPLNGTLADRESVLLDPAEYRTSMVYDALNRAKAMHYPQDVEGRRRVLRPQYNRAGGLEAVTLDGEPYVEQIAYNAKGQRSLIALGNGVMTRYAYDPQMFRLRRLRSERFTKPAPDAATYRPAGTSLQDFAYDYDLVGNILAIHDRTPGSGIPNTPLGTEALDRTFGYDPLYRLLSATGRECATPPPAFPGEDAPKCQDVTLTCPYSETYTYDRAGNLLQLRHQAGQPGNAGGFIRNLALVDGTNRLQSLTVGNGGNSPRFDYVYDANGNLTAETTSRHFEWDHSDRMKAFRTQVGNAEPSVHAHYLYDASGMRVKKLVRRQGGSFESTTYVDGAFEHHSWDAAPDKQNNHLHVMDDQQRIALVRVGPAQLDDRGPAVQFHLGDHLGSSNLVVNRDGNFVNREEHTPYGETSFGSFGRKRYRYMGKERNEESGLVDFGLRLFAVWLARWISPDPLGPIDGPNSYLFVRCCPLRYTDSEGTQATSGTSEDVHRHHLEEGAKKLDSVHFGLAGESGRHPDWEVSGLWEGGRDSNGNKYRIKTLRPVDSSRTPSKALWELVQNSGRWSLDCSQFIQVLKNYEALRILGPEKYDEVIKASNQGFSLKPFGSTVFTKAKAVYVRDSNSDQWTKTEGPIKTKLNANVSDLVNRVPTGSRVLFHNEKGRGNYYNENTVLIKRNDIPNQFIAHGFDNIVMSETNLKWKLYGIGERNASVNEAKKHVWIKEIAVYEDPRVIYQKMISDSRVNSR